MTPAVSRSEAVLSKYSASRAVGKGIKATHIKNKM